MKKLSVFLSALLLVAALVGCGASEKAQEKAAENAIEDALGDDVQVDIDGDKYTYEDKDGNKMEVGGTEWPSDAAAEFIPKFEKQPVTACTIMGNVYLIDIENVAQKDYENYLQAVKDAGFTESVFSFGETGYDQYQAGDGKGNGITLSYEVEAKKLQIMGTAAEEE